MVLYIFINDNEKGQQFETEGGIGRTEESKENGDIIKLYFNLNTSWEKQLST